MSERKKRISFEELRGKVERLDAQKPRFAKALLRTRSIAVIAEIKKKSPSKGIFRKDFDPLQIAKSYERAGAAALSVLTDKKFFGGSSKILKQVRGATSLPILRKDFIIDEYQVYEARLMGADAVLLIARILSRGELKKLSRVAASLGLDVLFEIHDEKDASKIAPLKPRLVGINNRDLSTFEVDRGATRRLARHLRRGTIIVAESGIQNREDLLYLKKSGARAALVGEGLVREKDPEEALRRLLGKSGAR